MVCHRHGFLHEFEHAVIDFRVERKRLLRNMCKQLSRKQKESCISIIPLFSPIKTYSAGLGLLRPAFAKISTGCVVPTGDMSDRSHKRTEREREREERERDRDRDTEPQRDRETERQRRSDREKIREGTK